MINQFHCELTNTKLYYRENAEFKVYVRRSNCPMKLLKITRNVKDAIDAYNSVKLFHLDRAYVYVDGEKKLLRSGKEQKPYSLKGYKRPPNYKRKTFATPNMPETAHNTLMALDNITFNQSKGMSMSKAIILMACKLASMNDESKMEFLRTCISDYKYHLKLSGCDNVDLKEFSMKEFGDYGIIPDSNDNEDDLL